MITPARAAGRLPVAENTRRQSSPQTRAGRNLAAAVFLCFIYELMDYTRRSSKISCREET
jgi:hypothetical protein